MDKMREIEKCQEIVRNNLSYCCLELTEWWNSGILCNGIIRDVARKLRKVETGDSLRLAERIVEREAVKKCSFK